MTDPADISLQEISSGHGSDSDSDSDSDESLQAKLERMEQSYVCAMSLTLSRNDSIRI